MKSRSAAGGGRARRDPGRIEKALTRLYIAWTVAGVVGLVVAAFVQGFHASALGIEIALYIAAAITVFFFAAVLAAPANAVRSYPRPKRIATYAGILVLLASTNSIWAALALPRALNWIAGADETLRMTIAEKAREHRARGCSSNYWIRLTEWPDDYVSEHVCVDTPQWNRIRPGASVELDVRRSRFGVAIRDVRV